MRCLGDQGRFIVTIVIFSIIGTLLLSCQAAQPPVVDEPICAEPGTTEVNVLEGTSRGYGYNYGVYLPPCYDAEVGKEYPVLYLLPGRGGNPSDWFNAGVREIADAMILSGKIAPFIIIATEEISSDSLAEIIYNELTKSKVPH